VQPENAKLLIIVTEPGIVILANLVLFKNALSPMLVIVEARIIFWLVAGNSAFEYPMKVPNVIFNKLRQLANAELCILVTELGIVILDNFEQLRNALEPIFKREEEGSKATLVRPVQFWNALESIIVVALGIVILDNFEQLINILEPIFKREEEGSKVTLVRLVQVWNAFESIIVVALGIVIPDNFEQVRNALVPI